MGVAVALAGPYADHLHLAPYIWSSWCQHLTTDFLKAGCPSCHSTNSVKTLKAKNAFLILTQRNWKSETKKTSACNNLCRIDWVMVLHPTRHKIGHFGDDLQANLLAWYRKTEPNTTKAHIHQKKCTTTQSKHTKTKAKYHLLQHLAWKRKGPDLISVLHKFVTYWLTYLDTYPLTYSPRTHMGEFVQDEQTINRILLIQMKSA